MKRALAILMALTMLVCLAVPSFADHHEHEPEPVNVVVVVDTPHGDVVKTGFGTAEQPVVVNDTRRTDIESVSAFMGGVAEARGTVKENVNANFGADVDVKGNVGNDVNANWGSAVEVTGTVVGDVNASTGSNVDVGKNVLADVTATTGATVNVGNDVKEDVTATKGATVNVGGDVDGFVDASKGANVDVKADVEGNITASKGATVTVGDDAESNVTATEGATVTIGDDVWGSIDENGAIVDVAGNVLGNVDAVAGTVTIGGNVFNITETGAIVDVDGTVKGNITAIGGTVTAGDVEGDVTATAGANVEIEEAVLKAVVEASDDNTKVTFKDDLAIAEITIEDGAKVIVVGELSNSDVDIDDWKTEDIMRTFRYRIGHGKHARFEEVTKKVGERVVPSESELIVGELGRNVDFDKGSKDSVFFLVGLDANSAAWADLITTGLKDATDEYKATDASLKDVENFRKETVITFKASDADNKVLESIEGLPEKGVKLVIDNGVATLSLAPWFKGGLQDLVVVLKDIAKVIPGCPTFYVDYGTAPVKSSAPTVVSLTGAAGAEKYEGNGHVGLTFSAEYLKNAPKLSTVKVTNDTLGEELTSSQYSLQGHQDGSTTLTLSNTYLNSIGAGDYQFTVTLGEDSFVLTINVPAAA